MAVPILNLQAQYQQMRQDLDAALLGVLASGQFILGPNVAAFEQEMAAALQVRRAIGVASGTDALHLAVRAMRLGLGDLAITSPFTFIATATALSYAGARPVFADIRPGTFTLDPECVAECLAGRGPRPIRSGRVRAVLPVDQTTIDQLTEQAIPPRRGRMG